MTIVSKYDRYLDGRIHVLRKGREFTGDVHGLRETLHKLAKRRGCRVQTKRTDKGLVVVAVEA